jgi:hypothetical protein
MNISQIENKINITSVNTSLYSYVHVINSITVNNTLVLHDPIVTSTSTYTLPYDGYFVISEIKLPTTPGNYYYTQNGSIYNPSGAIITTEELLDTNTQGTNIIRSDEDHVSIYYLQNYYINLLKSKYLKNICNCGCGCIDKVDKVKLDTLTMGLDLIEALLSKVQYYEVQRIIEKLMVCFGIVDNNCNCR